MEAIRSSETSANTISTRRHIPEDCCLQNTSCLGNNGAAIKQKTIIINFFKENNR
jgi:hypothetical protein